MMLNKDWPCAVNYTGPVRFILDSTNKSISSRTQSNDTE